MKMAGRMIRSEALQLIIAGLYIFLCQKSGVVPVVKLYLCLVMIYETDNLTIDQWKSMVE